ncbi:AAA family ATPase [Rhodoligotrophos defluvii]|uniref:AAA family ATPase n=1 Tax=Rhodoligotrophos defluvii TaxID=2561934 RepID=UPI0010C94BFC|nr:AAA family ATPase [Rhodoligotrophos defluvii]
MTDLPPFEEPPSVTKAVAHLKLLDPTGWHNLVAIDPDEGNRIDRVIGRTFPPNSWDQIAAWIKKWLGKRNIYYSANEPKPHARHTKLLKSEIANIRCLYADVDPSGDAAQLEQERQRLLDLMRELQNDLIAPPSIIVDSGAGYQPIWRLATKLPAKDWAQWAEAQGNAIRLKLTGDPAWDINRVLRLPFTINLPTAKKIARGRTTTVASVLASSDDVYDDQTLSIWLPPVRPEHKAEAGLPDIDMAQVVAQLEYDELPDVLRNKFERELKRNDPLRRLWGGEPLGHDQSNSGYLWQFAMLMRKAGFDVLEYAQLAWTWEHIDLQERAEHDAERQLRRAWVRVDTVPASEEFGPVELDVGNTDAIDLTEPTPESIEDTMRRLGLEIQDENEEFDPAEIPRREWILDGFLAKEFVAEIVAAPGVGKTTLEMAMAVGLAAGRSDIAGMKVVERTPVLFWNQEDDLKELRRRFAAIMQYYELTWDDLRIDGRPGLRLRSGVGNRMVLAKLGPDGRTVRPTEHAAALQAYIHKHKIGVVFIDPLIKTHQCNENDNNQMDQVGDILTSIAAQERCAICFAHHTRKPPAGESDGHAGNIDSGRGASAVTGFVRMHATLVSMSEKMAQDYGVPEDERWRYLRFDGGKNNLTVPGKGTLFYKRTGVMLASSQEEIGMVVPVEMARGPDKAEQAVARVIKDAVDIADGRDLITVADLAKEMIEIDPMYADRKPVNLRRQIVRAFTHPGAKEICDVYKLTDDQFVQGKRGRHVCLVKLENNETTRNETAVSNES